MCVPLMGYQWKLFTENLKKVTVPSFIRLSILYHTVLHCLPLDPGHLFSQNPIQFTLVGMVGYKLMCALQ